MPQNKSPQDIIHKLFPETKLSISNVEQRSMQKKQKIKSYQQGHKLGIINRGMVHEHILAKQLHGHVIPYTLHDMRKCDRLIYIGPFLSQHVKRLRQLGRVSPGTQIYIWWIGTDVYNAMNRRNRYRLRDILLIRNSTHLAVSETLQAELKTLGITSDVLTLVPDTTNLKPLALPKNYAVAVYMPSTHLGFYKYGETKRIVKALPKIKFLFYGNKDKLDVGTLSNVEVRGWVRDTRSVFRDCNALLRLTIHDGFPKSIIEAVLLNRYVISNQDFPQIMTIKDVPGITRHLKKRPALQKHVRDYYSKTYSMKNTTAYFGGR